MMKLASWNVNGIRACVKKGFIDWLRRDKFDVICVQETKAQVEQLQNDILSIDDYESSFFSAEKKGYSGVAIFYKKKFKPKKIIHGLGIKKFDCEGRTIIFEYPKFVLINCYYPNGQRDHNRVPYKLEFSNEVLKLANKYRKQKKHVILTGDFNTAHHEIDLKNHKTNKKTTGFLPNERAFLDKLELNNYYDCFRAYHPEEAGHYTWWTYRGDCRERNIGWRIDYFWANTSFKKYITDASIHPKVMGSDHCPISIDLKI